MLGSSCNMFEYDKSSKYCNFLPSTPQKSAAIYDVLLPDTSGTSDIYIMHCSGAQENLVSNSDFFTRSKDPWVIETNCSNSYDVLVSFEPSGKMIRKKPSLLGQHLFSYQVKCFSGEETKLEQVIDELPFGIGNEYLTLINPMMMLTYWFSAPSKSKINDIFDYGIILEFFLGGSLISEMSYEKIQTYKVEDINDAFYTEFNHLVQNLDLQEFDSIK